MKKFGYFVIGILTLCMTVAQGETKVIAQNTDRVGKVKTEHYYTKKKKNVEFRDIGGGYSKVIMKEYVPEYKITKGNYRIIKKEFVGYDNSRTDKLIIEDLKGNILFQTYDLGDLGDVAIGKDSLYYFWRKGGIKEGIYRSNESIYRVDVSSGERNLLLDVSDDFIYLDNIKKNRMYLKGNDDTDGYPTSYNLIINLKDGECLKVEDYFIKEKTLYYSVKEKGDYRKLFRCKLDFTKLTYLGKYKGDDRIPIFLTEMLGFDGTYVYYVMHSLHSDEDYEFKFKLIKNTKK